MTAMTVVNQGTLKLSTLSNTLSFDNFLYVGAGGTVDLNGSSQYVETLFTDGSVANTSGGTVTNSAVTAGTLIVNQDSTNRNFSGFLTGNLNFERAGQNTLSLYSNNTYTGATVITGGTTVLRALAQLSGTSSIDVNYATLQADNNVGTVDLPDRINNAAPITLRGGTLTVIGRAETASSETVNVVTLAQGYSTILATVSNTNLAGTSTTGVASIDLTLQGIAQGYRDAVVNFSGTGGGAALGTIGSNPRIEITNAPTLTNNIIGGWAVVGGTEFASYNPTYGVGALNQAGFAGYDFSQATLPANIQPSQNLRLTALPTAIQDSGLVVNSLNLRGSFDTNFTTAFDTINIVSGGFIANAALQKMGSLADTGRLTAGGSQSTGIAPLYIYNNANTYTINARIIDTATPVVGSEPTATGAKVRLIIAAAGGTVQLADPNNSYSGGTVVDGGTLTLGVNASFPGIVIPFADPSQHPDPNYAIDSNFIHSGLVIDGGTVAMLNTSGQIDPRNIVSLSGNGTLNLFGSSATVLVNSANRLDNTQNNSVTNTLASLVFNDNGGGATNAR